LQPRGRAVKGGVGTIRGKVVGKVPLGLGGNVLCFFVRTKGTLKRKGKGKEWTPVPPKKKKARGKPRGGSEAFFFGRERKGRLKRRGGIGLWGQPERKEMSIGVGGNPSDKGVRSKEGVKGSHGDKETWQGVKTLQTRRDCKIKWG